MGPNIGLLGWVRFPQMMMMTEGILGAGNAFGPHTTHLSLLSQLAKASRGLSDELLASDIHHLGTVLQATSTPTRW